MIKALKWAQLKYKLHLKKERKKQALNDSSKQVLHILVSIDQSETNGKGSHHDGLRSIPVHVLSLREEWIEICHQKEWSPA